MRLAFAVFTTLLIASPAAAQDLSRDEVLASISAGKSFLLGQQVNDGSWSSPFGRVGPTCLATLALIQAGESLEAGPLQRALAFLRAVPLDELERGRETYEASLLLMALAAAGDRDHAKILAIATRLEQGQITTGSDAGMWGYSLNGSASTQGDRSNMQFAILALHEAALAGLTPNREVWRRIRKNWMLSQNADGGWGYARQLHTESYGSMTVAGLASLNIAASILQEEPQLADGAPDCCASAGDEELQRALDRAERWMERRFAVTHNPGVGSNIYYYLYGLERAGRFGGRRFYGDHDWSREGTAWLLGQQSPADGHWRGVGQGENDPVIGTSFTLLFLTKGLAPVLVNRLQYAAANAVDESEVAGIRHPQATKRLVEFVSKRPHWPRLLTSQDVNLDRLAESQSIDELLQAPVLSITGRDAPPALSERQSTVLRSYLDQGGFLFVTAGCNRATFDEDMPRFMSQIYPNGEGQLSRLPSEHPVYRAEFLLDSESAELWGVDVGCRTAIIYAPQDLGCYWERWRPYEQVNDSVENRSLIEQRLRMGVNVLAYATGREPPTKLDIASKAEDPGIDAVERGVLQIAPLRHDHSTDVAPRALANLVRALNERGGLPVTLRSQALPPDDEDLYRYPLVNMHGRTSFTFNESEIKRLRAHLDRGGVLFADACCGAPAFDGSFRALVESLYPDRPLQRIPPGHAMFGEESGFDVSRVQRKIVLSRAGPLRRETVVGPPFLEGVEVEGRYVIVYSKYDLSCAIARQSSTACEGYVPEDALKIALNIVLHSMLQEVASVDAR